MAEWHDTTPTAANQVLTDIANMRAMFDELEAVVENLTGDTLGTDEPSSMVIVHEKLESYVSADEALSDATEVTFTALEAGKHYRLEYELVSTDGNILDSPVLKFGTSGGIDSGANYDWLYITTTATSSTSANFIKVADGFETGYLCFGTIDFATDPGSDSALHGFFTTLNQNITSYRGSFGYDNGGTTIDRVQLTCFQGGGSAPTFSGRARLFKTN